jgi:cytoskeletal protein CcmA (bactofilin family)
MTLFARRKALPAAGSYSLVDEHLTLRGEIQTEGTIRVDGRVEGAGHRADTLIIGTHGLVVGDIEAREVIVSGSIDGNVVASARIEVHVSASIRGNIAAGTMLLHEGGTISGRVAIGRAGAVAHSSEEADGLALIAATTPTPAKKHG